MHIDFSQFFYKNASFFCVASVDGFFVEVNKAFCDFLGYTKTYLLQRPFVELIHPDDRDKTLLELATLAEGKTTFLFENRYQKSDKTYVSLLWNAEVNEASQLIYAGATDITNLKEQKAQLEAENTGLEAEVKARTLALQKAVNQLIYVNQKLSKNELFLKEALQKEKQLHLLKSRFVAMASHEFRTPLSTILSSASLIARYSDNKDVNKREKHIKRIESSVNNMIGILNDFLSLGKLEEGAVKVEKQTVNLFDLCETTIGDMKGMLKKGQRILLEQSGNHNTIITDARIVRNILHNLLSNAIKYSPDNAKIICELNFRNSYDEIVVQDFGYGIPQKEQNLLFKRFFRASNVLNIQGTGLGLDIVKHYVKLIDGDISFESVENEGTTFFVNLPK
jgi:PAS domain S-box-containing protein